MKTASVTTQYLTDATVSCDGPLALRGNLRFAKKLQQYWSKLSTS